MANEFKSSIVDFLKERTTTPLWANFIFVWCIYNWHVLVIIFYSNSGNAISIISTIKEHNFSYWWPIIWAILITIIVPVLNYFIFWFIENFKRMKTDLRIEINNRGMRDVDKYDQLVKENIQLEIDKKNLNENLIDYDRTKKANSELNDNLKAIKNKYALFDVFNDNQLIDIKDCYLEENKSQKKIEELTYQNSFPDFMLDIKLPLVRYSINIFNKIQNDDLIDLKEPELVLELTPNSIYINSIRFEIILMRTINMVCQILASKDDKEVFITIRFNLNLISEIWIKDYTTGDKTHFLTAFHKNR